MLKDKHFILLIFSLAISAVFGHIHARTYRAEMNLSSESETFGELQKSSEAYFTMTDAVGEYDVNEEDEHSESAGSHENSGSMSPTNASVLAENTVDSNASVHAGCGCAHDHGQDHSHNHDHEHNHDHGSEVNDPSVSPGFALLLRQLGFAELAANLLWIQMDADSHREMWHRVDFALDLIPLLDPTFVEAYLLKSFILDTYRKKHEEALEVLEKAIKHVANRIELWQQIGMLSLSHGGRHGKIRNLPRALEAFTTMQRFSDPPPYTVRLVAITLAAMDRRDEAIKLLEESANSAGRDESQRELDLNMLERVKSDEKF